MRSRLERLSKPELDFLFDNCNFSEEEIKIIKYTAIGKSEVQVADELKLSVSGVSKKKNRIIGKIKDYMEVAADMTTIYVDGKRVTKDELKNYEIQIESVKKIILGKLTKSK